MGPPIIAVTVTRRELHIEALGVNIARALKLAGRTDIPYYLGSDTSLTVTPVITGRRFGNDALGDVPYDPTGLPVPQEESAVLALIRHVNENKGNAVIITTAALTNIALAIKIDPTFLTKVKRMIIGAGAVRGLGNIAPGVEYKVWRDPEAMEIVLANSNFTFTELVTGDGIFDIDAATPIEFWLKKFYLLPDPAVKFLKTASQVYWNNGAPEGYALGDPIIAVTYLEPKIIQTCEAHLVSVSTACDASRGALFGGVTDFSNWKNDLELSNVSVVAYLKAKLYQDFLMKLFS